MKNRKPPNTATGRVVHHAHTPNYNYLWVFAIIDLKIFKSSTQKKKNHTVTTPSRLFKAYVFCRKFTYVILVLVPSLAPWKELTIIARCDRSSWVSNALFYIVSCLAFDSFEDFFVSCLNLIMYNNRANHTNNFASVCTSFY